MNNSVTIDYVIKKMRETERGTYYIEEASGDVLSYNDDAELKLDAAIDKFEGDIAEISGNYVYVRLHHKAAGANKPGGNQKPILRYKVFIGAANRGNEVARRGDNTGLSGMGNIGFFEKFFTRISELEMKVVSTQKDAEIEKWKRIAEERRQNSYEEPIDLFTSQIMKKFMKYEAGKDAVAGAKTPLADDAGKKHEEATERMLSIIKNFSSIDDDYLSNLEMVSKYAKSSPEAYFGLLTKLKENGF